MATNRVILMGGLGNQLFQCAFAKHLSSVTNSDVIVDPNFLSVRLNNMGDPDLNQFVLTKGVSIASADSEFKLIQKALGLTLRLHVTKQGFIWQVGSQVTRLITAMLLSARFRCLIHLYVPSDTGYEEVKYKEKNSLYLGYFQTFVFADEIINYGVKELFKIKSEPQHKLRFENLSKDEKPLLVHVRLTDYRLESNFGILSKEYYKNAIEFHFRTSEYGAIWLFSDEPEMAVDYIPVEFKHLIRNVSNEISDAVETLDVMTMAHGYVLANSSYSWWAAFLSRTNAPVVTYPSPWFAQMPEPNQLFPAHWQAIAR